MTNDNTPTAPAHDDVPTVENARAWLKYAATVIARNHPGTVTRDELYPAPSTHDDPGGAYGADEFTVTDPAGTKRFRLFRTGAPRAGVSVAVGTYPRTVEVRLSGDYRIDSKIVQVAAYLHDHYEEGDEGDDE